MQTAYDLVWLSRERTPDHIALVDDATDRALSYRDLLAEIDSVAAGLHARGVRAGQLIATALPGLFDHGILLLALQRLGAVPALLNFRLLPGEIAQLVSEGGMSGAIILDDADLAAALGDALPDGAPLLSVGGGVADDFAQCRGDVAGLPPVPRPDPEDPAFVFYTSGTTGLPKGVVLAHRATEHRVLWLSTQVGLRHGNHNRALGFMPLSHCIGFYAVFLVTLAYGGTYYVMSAFDPGKAVDTVERYGITYMFAIPTLYYAMTKAPNYDPKRMHSTEVVVYGGAAIDPILCAHIEAEWGGHICHIYGTTEAMCSLYNPDPVGAPAALRPGFYSRTRAIRLGGGPDDIIAPGEEGELIIDTGSGAHFSGYLNRPDATAEKTRDGWYWSGDIVQQEANGDITLKGRVDDMIRSGGENIQPEEIEELLALHPGVASCSVIGIADAHWGQIVVGCVTPGDDALDARDLDAHCRNSDLAGYKRPKAYVFVDTLPRNAANKILRRVLRDQAIAARDGGGDGVVYHSVSAP
ncbi:MAG: AMP-binding protein [Alphaproteobacteria bacterium]|nr:AMP-binding protein [Alphaproteobacteria bacterium]